VLKELAHLHPDQWSKPFWDAAAKHELVCQACVACGTMRMPPTPVCWNCRSDDCEYKTLPGTGTIFTYSTTYFTASTASVPKEEVPYTVLVVELDEGRGCRFIGVLVSGQSGEPEIGGRVKVQWEDTADGDSIPRFELI